MSRPKVVIWAGVIAMSVGISLTAGEAARWASPETRKVDHTDDYHGTKVADPYRWLEDDVRTSKDVAAWVEMQNQHTEQFLAGIPQRNRIKERLTKLWDYPKYTAPTKKGSKYYYYKNDGLQNQYVLYVQETPESAGKIVIDPNGWSKDGTVTLAGTAWSDDGRYLAYGIQEAGSDWRTFKVMDLETGQLLADELKWLKFTTPSWTSDNAGFFYSRYDEPKDGQEFQRLNLNQKVYYHRLGQPQSADVLVYARPDQPTWNFSADVTEDGHYLIITTSIGTDDRYRVSYKDLREPYGMPIDLITDFDNEYSFLGNDGSEFYFKTDLKASKKRIIAIDIRKPARENWREVIPEGADAIVSAGITGNMFILETLQDAKTRIAMYSMDGGLVREVNFPGIGSASGFGGRRNQTETFYSFSSFATPPTIYRYDLLTGQQKLLRRSDIDVDPEKYEVKQVFFESKDGTRVPMFVAHKKGLQPNGSLPTLMYGYGGFNIPLTPGFSISRLVWMDMGGVFAMPNLRGGGEYGLDWHKAGTKERKQNVFDDFIAAGEWLIKNNYTQPGKLAIQGGSNGGLLVGACMTQRPDLFGACLPAVGVMDMLRFQKFTAGRYWVDDYGSSDDAEDFRYLIRYSPYQNLKPGTSYPATLVTTADTDDRVVPGHSFKFAARLQECHDGRAPVLIRIETRAGHGSGKPTSKIIEEAADQWAFLVKTLGMQVE